LFHVVNFTVLVLANTQLNVNVFHLSFCKLYKATLKAKFYKIIRYQQMMH